MFPHHIFPEELQSKGHRRKLENIQIHTAEEACQFLLELRLQIRPIRLCRLQNHKEHNSLCELHGFSELFRLTFLVLPKAEELLPTQ